MDRVHETEHPQGYKINLNSRRWRGFTLEASWPLETLLHEVITACLDSFVQPVQHANSTLPVHTCVGDRDTMLQARGPLSRNILASRVDMRLNHDTSDVLITNSELGADNIDHFRLIVVVLLRIPV